MAAHNPFTVLSWQGLDLIKSARRPDTFNLLGQCASSHGYSVMQNLPFTRLVMDKRVLICHPSVTLKAFAKMLSASCVLSSMLVKSMIGKICQIFSSSHLVCDNH